MADTLPTHEPETIRKGDTVKWKKLAIAYGVQRKPGDGWTLTYTLSTLNFSTTIASTTDDGGSFQITVAATVTDDWLSGNYSWQAKVSDGSETFTIDRGAFEVLPDFGEFDGRGSDNRSLARRTLAALESVLEGKARKDQVTYSIGDRSISRMTWTELMDARDRLRIEVESEGRKQRAKQGLAHGGIIRGVF